MGHKIKNDLILTIHATRHSLNLFLLLNLKQANYGITTALNKNNLV